MRPNNGTILRFSAFGQAETDVHLRRFPRCWQSCWRAGRLAQVAGGEMVVVVCVGGEGEARWEGFYTVGANVPIRADDKSSVLSRPECTWWGVVVGLGGARLACVVG
jgi:hypothetical protein